MNSPNLTKLVSIFLILAAVASSSVLVFLLNDPSSTPSITAIGTNSSANQAEGNPQIESLPQNSTTLLANAGSFVDEDGLPPVSTSSNLTEQLGAELARQVVVSNPNGPQKDSAGKPIITAPNVDELEMAITDEVQTASSKLVMLDESSDVPMNISDELMYKSADIGKYFTSIKSIVAETIGNQKFQQEHPQDFSSEEIAATQLAFAQAEKKLSDLSVPKPLASFHKSLLVLIKNQNASIAGLDKYSQDPLQTLVSLQIAQPILKRDAQNFSTHVADIQDAIQNTSSTSGIRNFFKQVAANDRAENKSIAHLTNELFGIQTAHADVVTVLSDITGLPISILNEIQSALTAAQSAITAVATDGSYVQQLLEWAAKIALEYLKHLLIQMITKMIVNWINGGGTEPNFVQNWQVFLENTASQVAGLIIDKIAPELCSSFGPLIRIHLLNAASNNLPHANCTIERIVQNVEAFYNDFSQGGWIAYGQTLQVGNNFYGSLFETSQLVSNEVDKAVAAANSEATAAQGFSGTKLCKDGKRPKSVKGGPIGQNTDGTYIYGDAQSECADGQPPQTTTPGATLGNTLYQALGAPIQEVVNADGIQGLVAAVGSALLTKVVGASLAAIRGDGSVGDNGISKINYNPKPPKKGDKDTVDPQLCADTYGAGTPEYNTCLATGTPDKVKGVNNRITSSTIKETCGSDGANLFGEGYRECLAGAASCSGKGGTARNRCLNMAVKLAKKLDAPDRCGPYTGADRIKCESDHPACWNKDRTHASPGALSDNDRCNNKLALCLPFKNNDTVWQVCKAVRIAILDGNEDSTLDGENRLPGATQDLNPEDPNVVPDENASQ